ncbi:MAG: PQQ-dependent sugar dehydrogenase [Bacteroidetes bacterium]|nr:PQQ-dependent sugar dehydrogenase [Bacteroidota bacterium]
MNFIKVLKIKKISLYFLFFCFTFQSEVIAQFPNFTNSVISTSWDEVEGFVWDSTGQQYVWEKGGKVWVVDTSGNKLAAPLLDITEEVGNWRDHGLNGFALDPDFRTNGFFYLFYTVDRHHLINFGTPAYNPTVNTFFQATIARVTRYTADSATNFTTTIPGSRFILIGETKKTGIPIVFESHSGGSLIFGADKSLFVSTGDGGSYTFVDGGSGSTYWSQALNDSIIRPKENVGAFRAQIVDCLNGKILRINPLNGDGLNSNPYFDNSEPRSPKSRVWALGFRNPFRMTLRPGTGEADITAGNPGTLYIGDVGWDNWEDLNVCNAPKQNFGWPLYEGLTPQIGYTNLNTQNQDAPNPLFGTSGCTRPYFRFKELLIQDTEDPSPEFKNPCDTSQLIPQGVAVFTHRRPIIDWKHGFQSRAGIFTNGVADEINIDDPASPVQGTMFGGYASIAGVWYTDNRFPVIWQNTYFHADYVGQWIRNFEIDTNDVLSNVNGFWDNNGIIVHMALNPVNGCIAYANYPGEIKEICYTGFVNNLPVAKIETDTTYGAGPLQVQFTGSNSSDPENLPLQYNWDFGDGNFSSLEDPVHIYNPGTSSPVSYYAKLTVTDDIGQTDTDSVLISVNNTPPQVSIISFSDGDLYSMSGNTQLPLEAAVTDAEHGPGEVFYRWTTILHHNAHLHPESIDTNKISTTTISPVGCEVLNTYYFEINLKVTDAGGLYTSVSSNLYAACDPPVATFTANDSVVCAGEQILFNDISSNFPVLLEWEFPGGIPAVSNDVSPLIQYNVPGIYDVKLIASSFRGSDTIVLPGYVTVGAYPQVNLGADTTVCGSISLNAFNANATYLWNDFSTDTELIVDSDGAYSVLVTSPEGCSATDTIEVVILTVPVVDLGPDLTVCDTAITFDAGLTGNLWLWNTGEVTSSIQVDSSGLYFVTVTALSGCQESDSINVELNLPPAFNLGTDTLVCDSVFVLNGPTGAFNYLWQDGTITQSLNIFTSGIYALNITDTVTGCQASDSISVQIGTVPLFEFGPSLLICDSVYILDPGITSGSFLWSDGTSNSTLEITTSGWYALTVTSVQGCIFTDSVEITIPALQQVTFTPSFNDTICINQPPFLLTGGSPSSGSYLVNGIVATVLAPAVIGQGPQVVAYTYLHPQGCRDTVEFTLQIETCTGISEGGNNSSGFSVYPNPSSGIFGIIFDKSLADKNVDIQVFNLPGQEVYIAKQVKAISMELDLKHLSPGTYQLRVNNFGNLRIVILK